MRQGHGVAWDELLTLEDHLQYITMPEPHYHDKLDQARGREYILDCGAFISCPPTYMSSSGRARNHRSRKCAYKTTAGSASTVFSS